MRNGGEGMIPLWMVAVVVNMFAVICLMILLANFGRRQKRFILKDQVVFRWMLATNIVMLLLDASTWVLNGTTFPGARTLNLIVTTAFYSLNPLMSVLYAVFCDITINTPPKTRKRLASLYLIPLGINLVLALASIDHSLFFHVGPDNVYSRGSMLAFSFILSYLLLPISFGRVLAYRIRMKKNCEPISSLTARNAALTLLLFPIAPLLGGWVQIWWNAPITVVWLATVIMLLIIFINIQDTQILTDELTGLYNRRQTVAYLQSLLQSNVREKKICLAILDVDNFKHINDRYGHLAGDHALRVLAGTLQAECDKATFISRYGGDEFVIITKQCDLNTTHELLDRVDSHLDAHCQKDGLPYTLSISAGVAAWSEDVQTIDALYAAADAELYRKKARMNRRSENR